MSDTPFDVPEPWKSENWDLKRDLASAQRRVEMHASDSNKWKHLYEKEVVMKLWWMGSTFLLGLFVACVVLLLCLVLKVAGPPDGVKVPTSGRTQETPAHILASVNILADGSQGSGTVISKGEDGAAILSAAHVFPDNVKNVWVYFPDGTYTKGEVVAADKIADLAVVKVAPDTVLGRCQVVATKLWPGKITGVGYTGGTGPNLRSLRYNSDYYNPNGKHTWDLSVTEGPFWDGDSGGGVFMDGKLIGVTSQRDAKVYINCNTYHKRMYAISQYEVVKFLRANSGKLVGCGEWDDPTPVSDVDRPPLWKPSPNVPIFVDGTDGKLQKLQGEVDQIRKIIKIPGEPDFGLKRPSDVPN